MYDLVYQLKTMVRRRDRSRSFATMDGRKDILMLVGRQLVELGYRQLQATEIKRRHVNKLVALWKTEGLSHATIRNRLAAIRWLLEQVGRAGAIPHDNAAFDLEPRAFVARRNKGQDLSDTKLAQIGDPYARMSLELQRAWGLRREESIKIRVWQADEGHQLRLQGSWCKGGRTRTQPLVFPEQREVLDQAKAFVGEAQGALIPAHLTYIQQLKRYESWTHRVGLSKLHGLRHAYFQRRFAQLTGFPCPIQGGPTRTQLTPEQQLLNEEARMIIAQEMGHCRLQICAAYLGS